MCQTLEQAMVIAIDILKNDYNVAEIHLGHRKTNIFVKTLAFFFFV